MDLIKSLTGGLLAAIAVAAVFLIAGPVKTQTVVKTGSLSGPEIAYDHLTWGLGLGSTVYPVRNSLSTGTSTSCAIQSPAATSTLESFSANITGGQQVAVTVTLTTGSAMQASTTALGSAYSLAAGAQGAYTASSSPETSRIISPYNWVQVNVKGGTGTASSTGTCTAVFRPI